MPEEKTIQTANKHPEPTPEPTPEDAPLSGNDIWASVIEHISKVKPLAADSAAKGIFENDDGKKFTVAISPDESIAHAMITSDRIRPVIEKCLGAMLGIRKFQAIFREGVNPPDSPPHLAEFEEPPEDYQQSTSPEEPEVTQEQTQEEENKNIYDDPLIKEALEVFEAVIKED